MASAARRKAAALSWSFWPASADMISSAIGGRFAARFAFLASAASWAAFARLAIMPLTAAAARAFAVTHSVFAAGFEVFGAGFVVCVFVSMSSVSFVWIM